MPVDYSQYHPKWSLISHLVRFVRAKGKCERCGSVHLTPHRISGYKVSLAIVYLDHNRKNNDFSSRASLCQWCHLKHDRSRHAYSRRHSNEVFCVNGYLFTLGAIRPQIVPIKNINAISLSLFDYRLQSPVLVKTLFDDVEQIA